MSEEYLRKPAWAAVDRAASRAFEAEVERHLPAYTLSRTESNTELDWAIPPLFVEAKEKRQPLGKRWHLLDGVDEPDLMVIDELSVRKALVVGGPYAYFLLRDCPMDRLFVASAIEVAACDRVRRNRVGKGKWIVDLTQFRQIPALEDLVPFIADDIQSQQWKQSPCLGQIEVAQI